MLDRAAKVLLEKQQGPQMTAVGAQFLPQQLAGQMLVLYTISGRSCHQGDREMAVRMSLRLRILRALKTWLGTLNSPERKGTQVSAVEE